MKIGIIGRSELTYEAMLLAIRNGYEIAFIVTAKEAPEYKYTSKDFENFAIERNILFIHDPKINAEKLINIVASTSPDICISVNYSGVISTDVIKLFPFGILNAHGGDLPRYRGNACQAWAIINGEDKIGLCIHKMIGGELDSGDIIAKSYFPLNINSRVGEVYDWMENEIPPLMLKAVEKLLKNPSDVEKQSVNPKDALRTYPRNPDDGEINWKDDAITIIKLINASSEPFSGAFTNYKDDKVIIWRAKLFIDKENYLAVPGQIAKINKDSGTIIVITGNGKIEIDDVEIKEDRNKPSIFFTSIRQRFK
ncbi:methionyl-tRNA formyltransferase [Patiriisocius sp. Uisw_017]|uniref:methionyl-tRNA formyltransferase n=1 Tax=Patiriisocius sp. Uisw_017 TaxID=3230968 RepID=UPI0039ECC58F